MDEQSLFFTSIVAISATGLMLLALQLLAKKLKIQLQTENKISLSYTIWTSSIMVAFFMYLKPALAQIENSIEILIYSKTIDNTFWAVMQKIIIFVGFTFIFTFLSYFVVHNLLNLLLGKRSNNNESANENLGYFILKGLLLIFLVFSIATIFEHFLGWFMPIVETPFYH
jgi:hypothetical protein